ncbi:MAG: hypothetical protein KDB03_13735 [Planctomycetales bacterium]|nr:hypothetical protein [Planctomycetales bacterium]
MANMCLKESLREPSLASQLANEAFATYLQRNVQASLQLHRLNSRFEHFLSAAPRPFVSKCIDGRVHTSDEKGYPPTTITYVRTEGTNVDLSRNNSRFWDRLHAVILDAASHTPGCPALFYALGHYGVLGSGCAAHKQDNDRALATVREQALQLRALYSPNELFVMYGMTNTDDHSLRLIFDDGHELDTARLIHRLNTAHMPLCNPQHVFHQDFLHQPLDDRDANTLLSGQTPGVVMEGPMAPMFHDLKVMVAMESYLINEMRRIVVNRSRNNVVFDSRLLETVLGLLHSVSGLPVELIAPLAYQTLWNVAYTLHERQRLEALKDEEQRAWLLQHAENMVAYGEGFELEQRNTLVLVKPGRGNDLEALGVAKSVILEHRHRRMHQQYPPLVHVNVEVTGSLGSWQAFNINVLAKLLTMVTNVQQVFDDHCFVLTTYSYRTQKRFYPVHMQPKVISELNEPILCFPTNLAEGLTNQSFSKNELTLREDAFSRSFGQHLIPN